MCLLLPAFRGSRLDLTMVGGILTAGGGRQAFRHDLSFTKRPARHLTRGWALFDIMHHGRKHYSTLFRLSVSTIRHYSALFSTIQHYIRLAEAVFSTIQHYSTLCSIGVSTIRHYSASAQALFDTIQEEEEEEEGEEEEKEGRLSTSHAQTSTNRHYLSTISIVLREKRLPLTPIEKFSPG